VEMFQSSIRSMVSRQWERGEISSYKAALAKDKIKSRFTKDDEGGAGSTFDAERWSGQISISLRPAAESEHRKFPCCFTVKT